MFETIPDILTFRECQSVLKVGKNTLLDMIHEKKIDAFRIGNRWKIPKDEIIEYIHRSL